MTTSKRAEGLSREITPMRQKGPLVLFGFRHCSNVPLCPCRDPGNYVSLEQEGDDPLRCQVRCWCGSKMAVTFSSLQEREQFIATGDTNG